MDFDVIPYEDIVWGQKLGSGSFGAVYKGSYLGVDIAIKEILPSTEYDVHKYFEREWRIMRECRHPNIVLFLGLCEAPEDDGRVFIVSEFVTRGNLRQYIISSNPFPWRLRLSFATDVARALAYLHARQCIHRDLKGENLLITSNERIKVTDFGFARIASRNEEELKRMTYCGTDGYMSPEIINGGDLDLPTDVFSLGIIFIEILSRKLVDNKTFIRQAPAFTPDPSEVSRRASPGCPMAFIKLALDCTVEDAAARPKMPQVLDRLRGIEKIVLARMPDPGEHVGSVKLVKREGKRAMPSFRPPSPEREGGLGHANDTSDLSEEGHGEEEEEKRAEEEALRKLAEIKVDVESGSASGAMEEVGLSGSEEDDGDKWRTARWREPPEFETFYTASSDLLSHERLLATSSIDPREPSTVTSCDSDAYKDKLLPASTFHPASLREDPSSTITVKGAPTSPGPPVGQVRGYAGTMRRGSQGKMVAVQIESALNEPLTGRTRTLEKSGEQPAEPVDVSSASAESPGVLGTHRFTLGDPLPLPSRKPLASTFASTFTAFLPRKPPTPTKNDDRKETKCAVCGRRLGQRPGMQCDDCHVVVHVKCSNVAPRNCTG